jgi:hypothetical protein
VAIGQSVALTSADCSARELNIQKGVPVRTKDVLVCDHDEFSKLEQVRRVKITGTHVVLSAMCVAINKRVAAGDRKVPPSQAEACRNRELFALNTDHKNGLDDEGLQLSMCTGKKLLDKTPEGAPKYQKKACTHADFGLEPLVVTKEPADFAADSLLTCDVAREPAGTSDNSKLSVSSNTFTVGTTLRVATAVTAKTITVVKNSADSGWLAVSDDVFTDLGGTAESIKHAAIRVLSVPSASPTPSPSVAR